MRLRFWLHFTLAVITLFVVEATHAQGQPGKDSLSLAAGLAGELSVALGRPTFVTELNRARTELPLFATTTQLLIAYTGYVGGLGPIGTTPRDPRPRRHPIPPELCKYAATMCRCWQGDRDACISLATDPESGKPGIKLGDNLKFVVTCATLRNDYTQALQAIMTLLGQGPLAAAQLQQLADLQAKANWLYNELLQRNCFAPV
jgi:hypothetical protein